MKKQIHPTWHEDAIVTCACGNSFTVGATFEKLQVGVCNKCHPFYTGQMKYVDTAGRVNAFISKRSKASTKKISKSEKRRLKREKRIQKELELPETLEEIRQKAAKGKNKKN
jgi:large subunit ribosomal protein L31